MKADNKKNRFAAWQKVQDKMSDKSGLAVVLVEEAGLSTIAESNNNSICQLLTDSEEFAPKCNQFCGQAFEKTLEAAKPLKYKCYAGLQCISVPIKTEDDKKFVAITGRSFVTSDDYRNATERAISGDWNNFPPTDFFENLILTSSSKALETLAKDIANLSANEKKLLTHVDEKVEKTTENKAARIIDKEAKVLKKAANGDNAVKESTENQLSLDNKNWQEENTDKTKEDLEFKKQITERNLDDSKEMAEWRAFFNSLLSLDYDEACRSVLDFLKKRYGISSIAWLENRDNNLKKNLAIGKLKDQKIQISMSIDDKRFRKLLTKESSIELKERNKTENGLESQRIRLFPISVGGEIRSALVIGEKASDKKIENSISRFCKSVAFELEILRLREELHRRSWLDVALQKFNDSLKMIDDDSFWSRLMQNTAELLQAERGSLLVYDEKSDELVVKSAIGSKSDFIKNIKSNVGEKIAKNVWESGQYLIVPSIRKSLIEPAPRDWKYKTESFISYPISIGERRIGVLNLADKVDGSAYKEFDLQLLQSILPQIAMAIDHATLKNKAGEFEQLSVTDSLTGLLNRRYLEERLDEEIQRSNRHGYPMSFLMIDVDDFKSYNDTFLHPEGDKALQIVGQCLRETLRGADIASRYGGEEFSILLPQTTLDEAEIIVERIRNNIETTRFPNRQVTVSIGIASISLTIDSVKELVKSADTALFVAKEKGKNNVQIFEDQRQEMSLPN